MCDDSHGSSGEHMRQIQLDSYENTGLRVALALVNDLVISRSRGPALEGAAITHVLRQALQDDPPSLSALRPAHRAGFLKLAHVLHAVVVHLEAGQIADAAQRLNALLAKHPANPHLALEDGVWRMHHHPAKTGLVEMWTSICAEALARLVGEGYATRLRCCEASDCGLAFIDVSRNDSRRFCSVRCQNRTKVAAYRRRNA